MIRNLSVARRLRPVVDATTGHHRPARQPPRPPACLRQPATGPRRHSAGPTAPTAARAPRQQPHPPTGGTSPAAGCATSHPSPDPPKVTKGAATLTHLQGCSRSGEESNYPLHGGATSHTKAIFTASAGNSIELSLQTRASKHRRPSNRPPRPGKIPSVK